MVSGLGPRSLPGLVHQGHSITSESARRDNDAAVFEKSCASVVTQGLSSKRRLL
jgi:hypothetical protein